MKFGVCGGPEMAQIAKECGYDYFEWSVGSLLHPREDESVFEKALDEAKQVGLPCEAANVFIPGDLKITGPEVNTEALHAYVTTALERAEKAGLKVIVFGSGGARRIPDGFDPSHAWQQLVEFCQWMGPVAQRHGVIIAIEPLNNTETNIITSAGEGAELARQANHPNIRLLVDGYHWAKGEDSLSGILDNASLLAHTHVSTLEGRRPPRPDDDCAPFFAALKRAGYDGRMSIEGNIQNPAEELPVALKVMKALAG
jgi:sugar phosphate isomerase/epimerase